MSCILQSEVRLLIFQVFYIPDESQDQVVTVRDLRDHTNGTCSERWYSHTPGKFSMISRDVAINGELLFPPMMTRIYGR